MRTWTETHREGTAVGPVDWDHPWIKECGIPVETLKAIEANPEAWRANAYSDFLKPVVQFCMYDGWPYWAPGPAVQVLGTLGPEWHFIVNGLRVGHYPAPVVPDKERP